MELEDFFNFKDFFRTMLLASAFFFMFGTAYGIFLHATYSSQILGVKQDLMEISIIMDNRSDSAYKEAQSGGIDASAIREMKLASVRADTLSKDINAPPVTPHSYTYFNYWVASAAFIDLNPKRELLGLNEKTIAALDTLEKDTGGIFGSETWWNIPQFRMYSQRHGRVVQFLPGEPKIQTYFWTFYIFTFIIGFVTAFLCVKEDYEIPTLPEAIYGLFMPLPFFIIFSMTGMFSYFGMGFLDKSQVNLLAILVSFVMMCIICIFASILAVAIKKKVREQRSK